MKLKKIIGILALFVLVVPTVVFASGSGDKIESGETIEGGLTLYDDTTIENGATINGDVAVFGGKLDLGGTINGDLIVFGGDVEVEGTVSGDIAVIGGDLRVSSSATIDGECVLLGGTTDSAHNCFNPVTSEFNLETLQGFATLGQFGVPSAGRSAIEPSQVGGVFSAAASMIFTAVFIGCVAFFMTGVLPSRMYEVRSAVEYSPYAAGGIGMLTAIAGSSFLILTSIIWLPLLVVLSFVCGLGIFLGFVGAFYLGAISLIGWSSIGTLIGKRFFGRMDEPLVAGIGTGVLTFALGMLSIVLPGITVMLTIVLFCVGLGGVVLTKLGRQSYPAQPSIINDIKINRVMSTLPPE
ncbi:MAG: hypothetical protein ACI9EW_002601 [Cellvibrionaceae bacterium]